MKKLRIMLTIFRTTDDNSDGGDTLADPVPAPPSGVDNPPASDPPSDPPSWMESLSVPEDQREDFKDITNEQVLDRIRGPVAPENYEFTLPEGVTDEAIDKDTYQKFTDGLAEVGKKHGLPQEALNEIAGYTTSLDLSRAAEAGPASIEAAKEVFAGEMKAWQTEVGATKAQEAITGADKAIAGFVTEGFMKLLDDTGLRNSPEVIQTFAKIGAAISEQSMPNRGSSDPESDARSQKLDNLYPTMKK